MLNPEEKTPKINLMVIEVKNCNARDKTPGKYLTVKQENKTHFLSVKDHPFPSINYNFFLIQTNSKDILLNIRKIYAYYTTKQKNFMLTYEGSSRRTIKSISRKVLKSTDSEIPNELPKLCSDSELTKLSIRR